MPEWLVVPFVASISSDQGGFIDGFNIREGDLLSILELSEYDKYVVNQLLSYGCRVIVPQRYLDYNYSTNTWEDYAYGYGWDGRSAYFGVDPLDNGLWMGGGLDWHSDPMSWHSLTPLDHWPPEWQYLFRQGYEVSIIPEIVAPADSTVYHKGDTIDFQVEWTMTYGAGQEQWIEEYQINSADYPPGMHTFIAEGWGGRAPVYDSVSLCVFTFEMREHLVEKYFTPLAPDSARIPYEIRPFEYADPNVGPKPISMEVEIRDCDSVVVYTGELSNTVQEHQVYWWDGKDNTGRYTDPEKSPYLALIKLNYRGVIGDDRYNSVIIHTQTINAPEFVAVPILTRLDPTIEIPNDTTRYMDILFGDSRKLYFSAVVLTRQYMTGSPEWDYRCYHPNPYTGQSAIIHRPEWDNQPVAFVVEKWESELYEIWGTIDHIRWCEIKPDIPNKEADDSDCVYYGDSIVLGNWTGPLTGFGWGWDGNHKDMSEGTLRYRVHVENRDLFGNLLQEATTPRGIDLFRVSVKGNYPTSEIVEWASSYLGVPFVFGIYNPHNWYDPAPNEYGQGILKHLHKGYEGLECSGLAGWAYVWVGEDLRPEYEEDSVDIVMTGATKLKELYGKANQEPDSARDGDMWFINTDSYPDMEHVGIYVEIDDVPGIIHASAESYKVGEPGDMVVKRTLERSVVVDHIRWKTDHFGGLGRLPHNQ